jgi:hypothetical protein
VAARTARLELSEPRRVLRVYRPIEFHGFRAESGRGYWTTDLGGTASSTSTMSSAVAWLIQY